MGDEWMNWVQIKQIFSSFCADSLYSLIYWGVGVNVASMETHILMAVLSFVQLGPVYVGLKIISLKLFYSCAKILKILLKDFSHYRAVPANVVRLQLKFNSLQFIVGLPVLILRFSSDCWKAPIWNVTFCCCSRSGGVWHWKVH